MGLPDGCAIHNSQETHGSVIVILSDRIMKGIGLGDNFKDTFSLNPLETWKQNKLGSFSTLLSSCLGLGSRNNRNKPQSENDAWWCGPTSLQA